MVLEVIGIYNPLEYHEVFHEIFDSFDIIQ